MTNLFERKIAKMGDAPLLQECIIHLKMLGLSQVDKDTIIRMEVILNEGLHRSSLAQYHKEFQMALKILKFI